MEKRWIWPFELEEQIGSGAMGVVYKARFVKNDRRVALKLLPPEVAANATLAARFQREMEILKDLRHPHIVHSFGGTCEGDQWFYAMELIEGGTLGTLLIEQGKLPWRQVVDFGLQICSALEHAHARGVIHRDLKPGNLLLTAGGRVKLVDFGLALVSAETKLTAAGKTMGSVHYMAPEQIQGKPPLSNRTDLYALGCVLFEMLTGRTPFTGNAMAEILQQHLQKAPPKVSSFTLDCPVPLEVLISDLLEKDVNRRPADAQAVAARLRLLNEEVVVKAPRRDFARSVDVAATRVLPTATASYEGQTRTNKFLAAGLVLSLALCAWLVFSSMGHARPFTQSEALLVSALKDASQPVRIFAAKALGELGPDARGALPQLTEALHDPDAPVRIAVARAIAHVAPGDAFVQAELRKIQKEETLPAVQEAMAEAVREIGRAPRPSLWPYFALGLVVLLGGAGWWASSLWKQEAQAEPARAPEPPPRPGKKFDLTRR